MDVKSAGVTYDEESGRIYKYEEVVVSTITKNGACDGKLKLGDVIKSVTIDGVKFEITRTYNVIDIMLTARRESSVVFSIERDGVSMDISIDMSVIPYTAA